MANKHRGEVALGDYTVSFSVNALADLEDLLGKPIPQIAAAMNETDNISMVNVRALLWAGLQDNHEVDLKTAGRIASDVGISVAMEAVGKAFALAFPDPADVAEAASGAGKKKAPADAKQTDTN